MSLWDIVAGISTHKTLEDHHSKWKKINSVSLDLVNGDGLAFTNEGGYTWNIFGANTNFVCDLESLIEGAIATKWHGHMAEGVLGAIFGPGANNNIVIGNSLTLNYMVGHSNNFTVMRGQPEVSVTYSPWDDGALGPDGTPVVGTGTAVKNRHKLMWLAIAAFALLVAGFDIALNILKNKINAQEESVLEDEAKVHEYEAIIEAERKEAEEQGQVVNPDAGGEPAGHSHAEEELHDAEHELENNEATLKKTETTFEWTMYSSIIAENRGIWLVKFLEQLCAGVKTFQTEMKNLSDTVAKIKADTPGSTTQANLSSAVENLELVIQKLEGLIALNPSADILETLQTQLNEARNLANQFRARLQVLQTNIQNVRNLFGGGE
jgi:hypothetical protein